MNRRTPLLLLALWAAACSSAPVPTGPLPVAPATVTDTFTGTVVSQSSNSHNFIVLMTSELAITLTAAGPAENVSLGIGIGIPSGFNCVLSLGIGSFATAEVSSVPKITGTAVPGTFCISVFDPDPLTPEDPVDYTITVAHS